LYEDEATAKIFDSGANRYREQAEHWARIINGGK
jgi:hypothetical protein